MEMILLKEIDKNNASFEKIKHIDENLSDKRVRPDWEVLFCLGRPLLRKRQILRSLPNYAPLFIGGAYCNIQPEVLSTMAWSAPASLHLYSRLYLFALSALSADTGYNNKHSGYSPGLSPWCCKWPRLSALLWLYWLSPSFSGQL